MSIVAFAGPSLSEKERSVFAGVEWLPPAEAGDLIRLPPGRVSTICLIDGYFDHRPAVRHKEILLLLAEGVRVFGASSIGALRAAEMQDFGMIGVGSIFRAYARGTIRGDDEVALVHADADRHWQPVSVPLVDVRATLCRALRESIVDHRLARALLSAAASIHYVDRDWPSVCQGQGPQSANFEAWLKKGAVAQKQADAAACLRAATNPKPVFARPKLVRTCFLDGLARACGVDLDARNAALFAGRG